MTIWQEIVVALTALGIVLWLAWVKRNQKGWRLAVAPLSYLFHVMIFNISAAFHLFDPQTLNNWSNGVRIHSVLLVGGLGVILLLYYKEN